MLHYNTSWQNIHFLLKIRQMEPDSRDSWKESVFISEGCCNNVPHIGWLRTRETYCLINLETESLRSKCWLVSAPSEICKEEPFLPLLSLGGLRYFLTLDPLPPSLHDFLLETFHTSSLCTCLWSISPSYTAAQTIGLGFNDSHLNFLNLAKLLFPN